MMMVVVVGSIHAQATVGNRRKGGFMTPKAARGMTLFTRRKGNNDFQ